MTDHMIGPPAPRPCASCPYRRDVPSGVWRRVEYAKLPPYDADTGSQPLALFQCHQRGVDDLRARMCSGWLATHPAEDLLSLRIAVSTGAITLETYRAALDYTTDTPVFASGAEAAAHGCREIDEPSAAALAMIDKIRRIRSDLIHGGITDE